MKELWKCKYYWYVFLFPGFTTNQWVGVNFEASTYSLVNSVKKQSTYCKYMPVRKVSCMKKSWAWNFQGWNEIFRDENEIFRDENENFAHEMKISPMIFSCMKISPMKLRTVPVPMKISWAKKSSQEFLPLLRKNLPIDGGAVCPDDIWPTLKISWVVFS